METSTEIEVRYAETDGMGVVYHANYLVYLEVARTDFLNKLGFPYADIEKQAIFRLWYMSTFHTVCPSAMAIPWLLKRMSQR